MNRLVRGTFIWIASMAVAACLCLGEDRITLKDGKEVGGKIVAHDENGITLQTDGAARAKYRWEDLAPRCAYELMRQYVDPNRASAHFALGIYCIATGLFEEAKAEFERCRELDASYGPQIDRALQGLTIPPTPKEETAKLSITPEQYMAAVRQNARRVNEKLGTNLKTSETEHFIIHSDFTNAADMGTVRKWCETLYSRLSEVLDVKPGDPLWLGKCEVFLFLDRNDFVRFAKTFDKFPEANLSGGYTKLNDRICRIVIPRSDFRARETFLYTLIHEGSHAFFQLHGNIVEIKPWLHEGFAQFFELALPKGSVPDREARLRLAKRAVSKPGFTRFSELRALDRILGDDVEAYALSWSMVDFLINADKTRKRFAKFIALIKDGKTEEEALKTAYGQTPDQIEQAWLRYLRSR